MQVLTELMVMSKQTGESFSTLCNTFYLLEEKGYSAEEILEMMKDAKKGDDYGILE